MGNATVTVIVPTYKRPEMLAQCLASVAAQDYPHFVALVCDNSPEREGAAVVADMQDPRFRYCPRERNLGILGNAVQGFADAETTWVMEVDDDDLLHPHCLSSLMRPLLADPGLAVSFANVDVIDKSGRVLPPEERRAFLRPDRGIATGAYRPFTDLAVQGLVYLVAAVLRRDAVDWAAIPSESGPAYDRYIAVAAARGDVGAYYLDEVVMAYRVHLSADSVMHESRQVRGAIAALQAAARFVPTRSRRAFAEELGYQRLLLARALIHERDRRSLGRLLREVSTFEAVRGMGDAVRSSYRRQGTVSGLLAGVVLRGRRRRAGLGLTSRSPSSLSS